MAATPTVLSADNGLVTVPQSGEWTAGAIQQVQTLLNANNVVPVVYGGSVPTVPAGSAGTYVLEVPNGTAVGAISVPAGYGAVIFGEGSSGTVTGGDANTTILSAASVMSYSGSAAEVALSATVPGAKATVVDNAASAVFALGGGSYSVTAGGNQQTIRVDDSGTVALVASGTGDTMQLGEPSGPGAASVGGGTNLNITGRGESVTVNSFGNIISGSGGGGSNTISGVTGSSVIFAGNNDVYYGSSAVTEFVGTGGAQTVFGGTGNDTVFNIGGNLIYNQGNNSASTGADIAVNESGNMTINGAGAGVVFAGSGSTDLVLGNSKDLFVGGGGSDSVYGGNVVPTVFGGSNESLKLVGSHTSFIVAAGSGSTIDASATSGDDNFFFSSATGNTTLVASSGAGDSFNLSSVAGGTAHVIDIQNWHSGDALFLNNFSASDVQTMDTAISGGSNQFVLSDGTTVVFTGGSQPTHVANGGGAIF